MFVWIWMTPVPAAERTFVDQRNAFEWLGLSRRNHAERLDPRPVPGDVDGLVEPANTQPNVHLRCTLAVSVTNQDHICAGLGECAFRFVLVAGFPGRTVEFTSEVNRDLLFGDCQVTIRPKRICRLDD